MRPDYEEDDGFAAPAYRMDGYHGIAWHVLGWEVEANEQTEWTGFSDLTGNVVAVMVGDDRRFTFDPSMIHPLNREDYCGECGQIGCRCDGLERE
jgi:hypothetical protein